MWKKIEVNLWDKYNRLTIIKELERRNGRRCFECQCTCWNIHMVLLSNLTTWKIKSCWCLNKELSSQRRYIHWFTKTPIYACWEWLRHRCNRKSYHWYDRYWWRWITYDPRWESFIEFYKDMWWSYKRGLTLDRKDNNWNYNRANCRWVTHADQARNRNNNILYKWRCLSEWCDQLWLKYSIVRERYRRYNFTIEEALELKLKPNAKIKRLSGETFNSSM